MNVVTFLKERDRMTDYCSIYCGNCPIGIKADSFDEPRTCKELHMRTPEIAVSIVENWSKNNPRKTYIIDLLEKYPKTIIDEYTGVPEICPSDIGFKDFPDCGKDNYSYCTSCWNQEMEK